MATTTNYGWSTPDDTSLVKDGAAAIRTLGSSVDTTTKALNPSTTLGDVEYRSATANTNTRLGIGTSGQVLSVSGGVPAWTTLPASSPNSATNRVDTQQTTTSTSYTALATAQSVTLTTGTKVMVIVSSGNTSGTVGFGAYASYAISGATTRAVSDTWATGMDEIARSTATDQQSYVSYQTVTAGSNTFTLQFRAVGGGTAYFKNRQITVVDLGS
jgi:hypothetical protein